MAQLKPRSLVILYSSYITHLVIHDMLLKYSILLCLYLLATCDSSYSWQVLQRSGMYWSDWKRGRQTDGPTHRPTYLSTYSSTITPAGLPLKYTITGGYSNVKSMKINEVDWKVMKNRVFSSKICEKKCVFSSSINVN